MERYIINSHNNQKIKFYLPWSSSTVGTKGIALKEFSYDHFINCVEEDLEIVITDNKKERCEIVLNKGFYEVGMIRDFICMQLEKYKIKDILFQFNKYDGKFVVTNNTKKLDLLLDDYTSEYLKLPSLIAPGQRVKSNNIFEIMKTKRLYLRVKDLRNGIYTNTELKGTGEIIHMSTITNNFGETKIEQINTKPEFYYFHNCRINEVEINITDEFGNYPDIQNINLILIFETIKL